MPFVPRTTPTPLRRQQSGQRNRYHFRALWDTYDVVVKNQDRFQQARIHVRVPHEAQSVRPETSIV